MYNTLIYDMYISILILFYVCKAVHEFGICNNLESVVTLLSLPESLYVHFKYAIFYFFHLILSNSSDFRNVDSQDNKVQYHKGSISIIKSKKCKYVTKKISIISQFAQLLQNYELIFKLLSSDTLKMLMFHLILELLFQLIFIV